MNAVTQKIAAMNMKEEYNPIECYIQTNGNLKCDGLKEEIKIEVDGTKPTEGKIIINEGKTLYYDMQISNDKVKSEVPKVATALNIQNSGSYTVGDKYLIMVNDDTPLIFYILSKNLDTNGNVVSVNLLMSQNLGTDGNYADSIDDNMTWYGTSKDNSKGPLDAIAFLDTATATWDNIESLSYTYVDDSGENKYPEIKKEGIKARLPKYSEIETAGCTTTYNSCPEWVVSYLYGVKDYKLNAIDSSYTTWGYWTSTAMMPGTIYAWRVYFNPSLGGAFVNESGYGVRPVITLPISMLTQS